MKAKHIEVKLIDAGAAALAGGLGLLATGASMALQRSFAGLFEPPKRREIDPGTDWFASEEPMR